MNEKTDADIMKSAYETIPEETLIGMRNERSEVEGILYLINEKDNILDGFQHGVIPKKMWMERFNSLTEIELELNELIPTRTCDVNFYPIAEALDIFEIDFSRPVNIFHVTLMNGSKGMRTLTGRYKNLEEMYSAIADSEASVNEDNPDRSEGFKIDLEILRESLGI